MSDSRNNSQVGLVGVGTMGSEILKKLVESGINVDAYDPSLSAKETIISLGGISCNSIKELAKNNKIIFLVLPGPVQVQQVTSEIIDGENRDGIIICDFTTSTPKVTQMLSKRCKEVGIVFIDTPILGRPSLVGNWCLPVGGPTEAIEKVIPILYVFADKVIRVGETGAGHTLKLLNQIMFNVTNAMVAEMFAVASRSGIDLQIIFDVISESGAATVSGLFKEVGRKIVSRDFDPLFSIDLLIKDAQLSLDMAESLGISPELGLISQKHNLRARDLGLGAEDTSALVKIFE
jgi:3-hydroxyisobutyrate dehydrogenase-like beta-hydroxyacid dehydrogenase